MNSKWSCYDYTPTPHGHPGDLTAASKRALRKYLHEVKWSPGQLGKGFITNSGRIVFWRLNDQALSSDDFDGEPFHCDVAETLGVSQDRGCFYINKDTFTSYMIERPADLERIAKKIGLPLEGDE